MTDNQPGWAQDINLTRIEEMIRGAHATKSGTIKTAHDAFEAAIQEATTTMDNTIKQALMSLRGMEQEAHLQVDRARLELFCANVFLTASREFANILAGRAVDASSYGSIDRSPIVVACEREIDEAIRLAFGTSEVPVDVLKNLADGRSLMDVLTGYINNRNKLFHVVSNGGWELLVL